MSRGPKKWTEDIINRMLLEGYGQGDGADYKPWLSVHTFSSMGRSHRVLGIKTGREHHLFSDVEWHTFLVLEWAREVVDIREQFPLDRELTLAIAAANQLRHPYYPGTQVPTVMTVDFLVTCEINGKKYLQVYDCKRAEDTENENTLQKLEIQRRYFDGIEAAYNLVLHSKLPKTKVQNLEWIRSALLKPEEQEPFPGFFSDASQRMVNELSRDRNSEPLNTYCLSFDRRCGYPEGTGLRTARMLMYQRTIQLDLNTRELEKTPLAALRINRQDQGLRLVGGM